MTGVREMIKLIIEISFFTSLVSLCILSCHGYTRNPFFLEQKSFSQDH